MKNARDLIIKQEEGKLRHVKVSNVYYDPVGVLSVDFEILDGELEGEISTLTIEN